MSACVAQAVQLDVSATGVLCRAKPVPPFMQFTFLPLRKHHSLCYGALTEGAGSPAPSVPQSGITLAAECSALPGVCQVSPEAGRRSRRQCGDGWGHPQGDWKGAWQPSWSDLPGGKHTSSAPQDALRAFPLPVVLGCSILLPHSAGLHASFRPLLGAAPSLSPHPAVCFFIAFIPI